MSVVAGKRGEGELAVITKANELMAYTITVCSNEKNFPKRYRWCITNKIVDTATEISSLLIHANAVYVREGDNSLARRLQYQSEALELTYVLLNLIDAGYRIFTMDSGRVQHWTTMVMEVQRLIRGWNRKDRERYQTNG